MSTSDDGQFANRFESAPEVRQLIEAAKKGDRDGVRRLLTPWRDYLLLIANEDLDRSLQAKLGASDLVQETMLTACEQIFQFQGSSPQELRSWLRRILLNRMRDEERKYLQGKQRAVQREISQDKNQDFSLSLAVFDPWLTPRADAVQQEEAAIVKQAISQLPLHYQQVVQLRNWEERSFAEIATELGTTAEAARKLWFRAITKLEEVLQPILRPNDSRESDE